MTRISFVVTTHQRPLLLARAIQSLKNQSAFTPQVIVVSDCDCADTREVARARLDSTDVFVQRHGQATGPAASRNLGMRLVDGAYFAFLDDDDAFGPNYLHELQPHLGENHLTFCNHHNVLESLADGQSTVLKIVETSLKARSPLELLVKNFIPSHAIVYPRSLLGKIAFDETLGYEDWAFILQAAALMPLVHADIFGPIVFMRDEMTRSRASEPHLLDTYRRVYARYPVTDPNVARARRELARAAGWVDYEADVATVAA